MRIPDKLEVKRPSHRLLHRKGWLVVWCLTALSAQTDYRAIRVENILRKGGDLHTIKQKSNTLKHIEALFHAVFVEIISLIQTGVLRGIFLDNHLTSIDNLTKTRNT